MNRPCGLQALANAQHQLRVDAVLVSLPRARQLDAVVRYTAPGFTAD